jgi:predicted nucleic acid-binding protein
VEKWRDGVVIQSATRLMCAVLWSENLNASQMYAGIELINPFVV